MSWKHVLDFTRQRGGSGSAIGVSRRDEARQIARRLGYHFMIWGGTLLHVETDSEIGMSVEDLV